MGIIRLRCLATLGIGVYALAVVLEVLRGLAIDRGGWADDERTKERRRALDELTQISEELGLYGEWWDHHG
jgi:hypothetical protein